MTNGLIAPFLSGQSVPAPGEVVGETLITAAAPETVDDQLPRPPKGPRPFVEARMTGTLLTRARETTDDEGGFDEQHTGSVSGAREPFMARYGRPVICGQAEQTLITEARETTDDALN